MARLTFADFVREQWSEIPPVATADLAGKTVMVIGANTGLGFEASKHFARMNPKRLIMACRNHEKGEAAVEKLRSETGFEPVELWIIDLAKFSSVSEFASKFEKDGGRLDILVQNAAAAPSIRQETSDGWENAIQVNNLSLPLLALLLLPRMMQTGREHGTTSRLVVVTSEMHYWGKIENEVIESGDIFGTLSSEKYCTPKVMASRYHDSKLLNVFFLRGLNDRLPRTPGTIIVNGVNPGYCYSELRRDLSGIRAAVNWIMEYLLAHTTEEGSRQLVWAAVGGAEEGEELRGAYISCSEVREVSDFVLTKDGMIAQDAIWDDMVKILVKIDPRVQKTIDEYLTSGART
ncbi:short-chain dehydrogenase [Collybia nuda]|uniref:Short-chain dehydrogenase n=1 Tax=Collybia nuda TaxID=64659 RepID=A0A9P5Y1J8_9AGAR|nr:short-chain dehydrogenase [Collybia nuda]